jgi:hypothetical protein
MDKALESLNEVLIDYKQNGVRVGLEEEVYYKLFATLVGSFICIAVVAAMVAAMSKK